MLTIALSAIGVFCVYLAMAIRLYGLPKSLSETFYLFGKYGWLFTIMMFSCAILVAIPMLSITPSMWQFTAFFCIAGIGFVGAAPAFRSCKQESNVHCTAAKVSALFAVVWSCLVMPYWSIAVASAVVVALLVFATKSWKKCSTFWLEMVAFLDIFTCLVHHLWK